MCSGRVDLEFILRAFSNGQDGVLIGGCRLGECNYITHGNFDAYATVHVGRQVLKHLGLNPERLRIEFMSGAEGNRLADVTDEFVSTIRSLGPIVNGEEEMGTDALTFKLAAARKLVPYLKLVERERLRAPEKTEQVYRDFFNSTTVNLLIEQVLSEKLAVSQILLLLKENPLSTSDIAQRLGLNPSDVSRHMNSTSRHGLVRYDTASSRYELNIA